MNEFDNVIFDDEELDVDEFNEPLEEIKETKEDLTTEVLKFKGIDDLEKIKFEDESGAIVERSWDSLSKDELLNILLGNEESQNQNEEEALSDEEIELLNTIRSSGMSVEDWLQSIIPQEEQKSYKIDDLSDEDVYALNLLEKIGEDNITDEELVEAVLLAKQNENVFNKTVEGLRKEYKKLQEDEEVRANQEFIAQQEKAYNEFSTSTMNEIKRLNTFAGQDLELSDEDKLNLADYILNLNDYGISKFGQDLQNSKNLTEVAFWLLNKEAIIEELTKQIQDSYKRGFEAGKGNSKLVFTKATKQQDNFDDEDW